MATCITVQRWPQPAQTVSVAVVQREETSVLYLWFDLPLSDPLGRKFGLELERFVNRNIYGFELCQGWSLMVDPSISQTKFDMAVDQISSWISRWLRDNLERASA